VTLWEHLHAIGPALALYVGAGVVLTADLVSGRRAPKWALSLGTLAAGLIWALALAGGDFRGEALISPCASTPSGCSSRSCSSARPSRSPSPGRDWIDRLPQAAEFYALLLTSAASMILLAQANDLITIFVALETTSISQFMMAGLGADDRSAEAGMKYVLTGAVAAAVLLYGFAFLFGISGTTSLPGIAEYVATGPEAQRLPLICWRFVFVIAGFGYKMALAPFHAWAPDVYQGAPTARRFVPVGRLEGGGLRAGAAHLLHRPRRRRHVHRGGLGDPLRRARGLSMIFGNTAALVQTNAKRLLGYSSIAQAGNIAVGLAAVAAGSTWARAACSSSSPPTRSRTSARSSCVHASRQRLGLRRDRDYAGLIEARAADGDRPLDLPALAHRHPADRRASSRRSTSSTARSRRGRTGSCLVAIAVVNTAISAFYYLRWMRTMWLDEPEDATPLETPAMPTRIVHRRSRGCARHRPLAHAAHPRRPRGRRGAALAAPARHRRYAMKPLRHRHRGRPPTRADDAGALQADHSACSRGSRRGRRRGRGA
jgi:NADH-quinone oxidoreductase subunit N